MGIRGASVKGREEERLVGAERKTKIMIKTESRELGGRKCKYVGDISMDGN